MSDFKPPIPIKNLFFMLCYAWNILAIKDAIKLEAEDLEDAYNLLTRLLVFGTQKLIRRGFNRSYVEMTEDMACIRGKIIISDTINLRTQNVMKCNCEYDDFSKNDSLNQILKYTFSALLKNGEVEAKLKKEIRAILLYFNGIDELEPTKTELAKLRFNRNNKPYKTLINICVMVYRGTLVNENTGDNSFMDFFREKQMQQVYESFILNFYAIHLDRNTYRVHAPKINWHIDETAIALWGDDFDVDTNPGDRRTDIVLENRDKQRQFIIDAKYYKEAMVPSYRNEDALTYRSQHLLQVRGYITDSDYPGQKVGALMYPTVKIDLDKGKVVPIQGATIFMKTLNLNRDWKKIEDDLLSFAHTVLDKDA